MVDTRIDKIIRMDEHGRIRNANQTRTESMARGPEATLPEEALSQPFDLQKQNPKGRTKVEHRRKGMPVSNNAAISELARVIATF